LRQGESMLDRVVSPGWDELELSSSLDDFFVYLRRKIEMSKL